MPYALHTDETVYAFDTRRQRRRFLKVTEDCEAITKKAFENLPPPLDSTQHLKLMARVHQAMESTSSSVAEFAEAANAASAVMFGKALEPVSKGLASLDIPYYEDGEIIAPLKGDTYAHHNPQQSQSRRSL